MNFDEKKQEIDQKINAKKEEMHEKKIDYVINSTKNSIEDDFIRAELNIENIMVDVDMQIDTLINEISVEIDKGEKPQEYLIYKSENLFTEIALDSKLRMQRVINNLIRSVEYDIERLQYFVDSEIENEKIKDKIQASKEELQNKIKVKQEELDKKIEAIKNN